MQHVPDRVRSARLRLLAAAVGGGLAVSSGALLALGAGPAQAEETVVPLGAAARFSVLAGSTVTNTGGTAIDRSVGVYPGTSITDDGGLAVGGASHSGDNVAARAQLDLDAAYRDAARQRPRISAPSDLGGHRLEGGVYNRASSMALTGTVTLDGQNDRGSVWVFSSQPTGGSRGTS